MPSQVMDWSNLLEKMVEKEVVGQQRDKRYFLFKLKQDGTYKAVMRFLPAIDTETFPYVKLMTHAFQGPSGNWFIENCPTTIGRECPVCEYCRENWKEKEKEIREQKLLRKTNYIQNVYMINDLVTPENNGKVFLWKYGITVNKMMWAKLKPSDDDIKLGKKPVIVFDYKNGCDFVLSIYLKEKFPQYDRSEWTEVKSIGDDKLIETIKSQMFALEPIIAENQFKRYEELSERFTKAMVKKSSVVVSQQTAPSTVNKFVENAPPAAPTPPVVEKKVEKIENVPDMNITENEDDFLASLRQ